MLPRLVLCKSGIVHDELARVRGSDRGSPDLSVVQMCGSPGSGVGEGIVR